MVNWIIENWILLYCLLGVVFVVTVFVVNSDELKKPIASCCKSEIEDLVDEINSQVTLASNKVECVSDYSGDLPKYKIAYANRQPTEYVERFSISRTLFMFGGSGVLFPIFLGLRLQTKLTNLEIKNLKAKDSKCETDLVKEQAEKELELFLENENL